ncbi:MAG: YdeI/OmpD-associated family protein [Bacteroides sp.]|nr:YdeI/OmpD-associated family protein [Bacteroides sp.]
MTIENQIKYFENREDWRKWLTDNFETAREIWFVFPTKSSGKKCITYNDAVEEALCFGWIDSTIKSLDKEHKIQRFTPRKPKSAYSQANKERLKWLLENKMIHPGLEDNIHDVLSDPFIFPNDIMDRLKEDEIVWINYQRFSDPYKRIRIAYIEAARKRPEEFEKRLNNFIHKTRGNKIITGFGGIEKYYSSK